MHSQHECIIALFHCVVISDVAYLFVQVHQKDSGDAAHALAVAQRLVGKELF